MSHVLTADGGTESLRVRIYDLDGRCVASHAEPYETKFMAGARAEQNAEDWWSSLVTATQICLKEANISGDAIDAMAYATTCCTVVALDKNGDRCARADVDGCAPIRKPRPYWRQAISASF